MDNTVFINVLQSVLSESSTDLDERILNIKNIHRQNRKENNKTFKNYGIQRDDLNDFTNKVVKNQSHVVDNVVNESFNNRNTSILIDEQSFMNDLRHREV